MAEADDFKGDDYAHFMAQKRFLAQIEQGLRVANRQIIHERIDALSTEAILAFAVSVGRLRARYLKAAFELAINEQGDPPDRAQIDELRTRREMYQEARTAFEALREAIEKGYVDIESLGTNAKGKK